MKRFFAIALAAVSFYGTARADTYACVAPTLNDTIRVQLRKSALYQNCFDLSGIPVNTKINVMVVSKDDVSHTVSVNEILAGNQLSQISQYSSSNTGTAFQIQPTQKMLALSIKPTSKLTTDKDLQLTYLLVNGEAQLLVYLYNVRAANTPPNPPPNCVPGTICVNPQITPVPLSELSRHGTMTPKAIGPIAQAAPVCNAQQKAPPGKPANFNTNDHLKNFKYGGMLAGGLPAGSSLIMRAGTMAAFFAPNAPYDLKKNPQYGGTATGNAALAPFGNYFYGAAAAQMGFSMTEALAAGAVVQRFTNYADSDPRKRDVSALAREIVIAVTTGQGDNLDDAAPIIGGHSYSTEIYSKDDAPNSHADSCTAATIAPVTGGFREGSPGLGVGGGWQAHNSTTVLLGGCYGDCDPLPGYRIVLHPFAYPE